MTWRQRTGRMLPALSVPIALILGTIIALSPGDGSAQSSAKKPTQHKSAHKPERKAAHKPAPRSTPRSAAPAASRRANQSTPDAAFVAARNAAAANDPIRFETAAAGVGTRHPLGSYVEYWRLQIRLAEARIDPLVLDAESADFVRRHAGTLVADLLRRDWILALGKRMDWARLDEVYAGGNLRDDPALHCLALQSRVARGDVVAVDARPLLLVARNLGEACSNLLETLAETGQFTPRDLWRRLQVAIEAGSPSAIRRAALVLTPELNTRQLDQALARPVEPLAAGKLPRELALVAVASLARADPAAAAERLRDPALPIQASDRAFLWSQVAAAGMRRLAPESLEWTREAGDARPTDETLAWMVRAALRAQDWPQVRATIERMSQAGQADPTWVYWLARSLDAEATPASQHQARVLYTSISLRPNFYSQLAGEELGLLTTIPPRAAPPTDAELLRVRAMPGLARAVAFYELGLRFEGNREWNHQIRGLNDRQLLAAAEYARQLGYLDRAIASAERTRDEHDYSLRFVTPFAAQLKANAGTANLDPAWIYGLIRQESRFVLDARSSAGASGLMQLMPATARWVAGKMGMRGFRPGQVNDLDTNLKLGTFYLRLVLDGLDESPLLASAAYNAGPGRPRNWRNTLDQPIEGAIFAEIIPFAETRGYVKAVLSNSTYYSAIFTGQPQSLRTLLGSVLPARVDDPLDVATAASAAPAVTATE